MDLHARALMSARVPGRVRQALLAAIGMTMLAGCNEPPAASSPSATPTADTTLAAEQHAFTTTIGPVQQALYTFQQQTQAGTLSLAQVQADAQPVITALTAADAALAKQHWRAKVATAVAAAHRDLAPLLSDLRNLTTNAPYAATSPLPRHQHLYESDLVAAKQVLGL
jgi:hypothetical protein